MGEYEKRAGVGLTETWRNQGKMPDFRGVKVLGRDILQVGVFP